MGAKDGGGEGRPLPLLFLPPKGRGRRRIDDRQWLILMAEWIARGDARGVGSAAKRAAQMMCGAHGLKNEETHAERLEAKFKADRVRLMAALNPGGETLLTARTPLERYVSATEAPEREAKRRARQRLAEHLHRVAEEATRAAILVAEGRITPRHAKEMISFALHAAMWVGNSSGRQAN
jgi:hypothetical protein